MADTDPAYIRVGRNAVEDVYEEGKVPFEMDKATVVREGKDIAIIACGEMVWHAKKAAEALAEKGIEAMVIDMYCIKPLVSFSVWRRSEGKYTLMPGMEPMVAMSVVEWWVMPSAP